MLEAMSCGCLLIGSRTDPVEEVIKDKQNGLLVDFFDIDSLAQKLLNALANPSKYAEIRNLARETIKTKYDLKDCLRLRLELIDKIIA